MEAYATLRRSPCTFTALGSEYDFCGKKAGVGVPWQSDGLFRLEKVVPLCYEQGTCSRGMCPFIQRIGRTWLGLPAGSS